MASAAVIDFGSVSGHCGDDEAHSLIGSYIDLDDQLEISRRGCSKGFEAIIGSSRPLLEVLDQVRMVAKTNSTVLIEGETGTGKELIANAIHAHSERRGRPFIKLNCAAIPEGLLESELFGHEKGAFTGALLPRVGRFEAANGGTLFLDEIGDIPLPLQTKLLRVLQEQEFERLGSTHTRKVDVRVVAATNRDLATMVAQKHFRMDLYYRLNVFPIALPPLRLRANDIPSLVAFFARKFSDNMRKNISRIPRQAMEALKRYPWPGNIRELQNVVERAVILTEEDVLAVEMSEPTVDAPPNCITGNSKTLRDLLEETERTQILRALEHANWVISGPNGAAARLGMKRSTLQLRMQKLGIRVARQILNDVSM